VQSAALCDGWGAHAAARTAAWRLSVVFRPAQECWCGGGGASCHSCLWQFLCDRELHVAVAGWSWQTSVKDVDLRVKRDGE
jgi:hypothetical protein